MRPRFLGPSSIAVTRNRVSHDFHLAVCGGAVPLRVLSCERSATRSLFSHIALGRLITKGKRVTLSPKAQSAESLGMVVRVPRRNHVLRRRRIELDQLR